MKENLNEVCKTVAKGKVIVDKVDAVFDYMVSANKPLRAKEIAEGLGFMRYYEKDVPNHQAIVPELRMLRALELIERFEVDGEPFEVIEYEIEFTYPNGHKSRMAFPKEDMEWLNERYYETGIALKKTATIIREITPKIAMYKVAE